MNRYAIHELKKVARTAARYAWIEAERPRMTGPARLTLIVRRGMKTDDDAMISGAKEIRDEIGKCLGYPSDRWIMQGPVRFECGRQWRGAKAHVEVWIEAMGDIDDDILRVSRAHREGQLLGITNRLVSTCDWLLSIEGCDLPAAFRERVQETHAALAAFVRAG